MTARSQSRSVTDRNLQPFTELAEEQIRFASVLGRMLAEIWRNTADQIPNRGPGRSAEQGRMPGADGRTEDKESTD